MLPPEAYPDIPSSSLTTRFVASTQNKTRCPVFCTRFSPDSRRVMTGDSSGGLSVWGAMDFGYLQYLQVNRREQGRVEKAPPRSQRALGVGVCAYSDGLCSWGSCRAFAAGQHWARDCLTAAKSSEGRRIRVPLTLATCSSFRWAQTQQLGQLTAGAKLRHTSSGSHMQGRSGRHLWHLWKPKACVSSRVHAPIGGINGSVMLAAQRLAAVVLACWQSLAASAVKPLLPS